MMKGPKTKDRVLIVDDNEANRVLLSDLCQVVGVTTDTADSGEHGLEQLRKVGYDLVLLDITMPGMDGIRVLKELKDDSRLASIPVLMISGIDDMEQIAECIQLGAADYLVKPFDPVLLSARIKSCIEKKHFHDREIELMETIKRNYEELKAATQSRDALAHMIVHDLNNPLSAIKGYAQLLMRNGKDEDKLRRYSEIILDTSEKMFALIQEILDVSRLESGNVDVKLEPLNSSQIATEIMDIFKPLAREREVSLELDIDASSSSIMADRSLLKRILQNLVSNALKHTPRGTNVSISAHESNGAVVLTVTDNGKGIPAELRDKVFDKYFQASHSKDTERGGVGLGLAFCKLAADAQGGHIWVDSEENSSTAFNIALPLADENYGCVN